MAVLIAFVLTLAAPTQLAPAQAADPVVDDTFERIEAVDKSGFVVQVAQGTSVAEVLAEADTSTVDQVADLSGEAFNGAVVNVERDQAKVLRDDPRVVSVERNKIVTLDVNDGKESLAGPKSATEPEEDFTTAAFTIAWGLDRSDQRHLPLDSDYSPPANGSGVHIYVVDSGVDLNHPDFGGRIGLSTYLPSAGDSALDCLGHGTHVAGTAASNTYGMAKGATVHSVRTMDCEGRGNVSDIIAGLNWIADNAEAKSVVNLSVGASFSSALNATVSSLVDSGIPVVTSAGNDSKPACEQSPASAGPALTVGAADDSDSVDEFSNFGPCIDLYAPGVGIRSLVMNRSGGYSTKSGTSMSAAHVTGATAVLWSQNPSLSGSQIDDLVLDSATAGVVKFPWGQVGSPNLNLHVEPADTTPPPPTPPTTPPVAPPAPPPVAPPAPPPASDTTAPNTQITSGTIGKVKSRSAKFYFNSTEAGSSFQCKLDKGSWQKCAATKSYSKLANGKHTFKVRATDKAGNTDRTPAARMFTTAKRLTVKLRTKYNRSSLAVNVNPNNRTKNYKFKVQKRVHGKWRTKKISRTIGAKDKRTLNMPRGKYRVKVDPQHDLLGAKSNSVRLRR